MVQVRNNQREQARAAFARYKDVVEGQNQIAWSFVEEKQYEKAVEIYRKLAIQTEKQTGRWLGQPRRRTVTVASPIRPSLSIGNC